MPYLDLIPLFSKAGGLGHDLGKATILFQKKLRGEFQAKDDKHLITKDPVRHEWVSAWLTKAICDGKNIDEAWQSLNHNRLKELPLNDAKALRSTKDVLIFIIATHHGLLGPKEDGGRMNSSLHHRQVPGHPYHDDPSAYLARFASLDEGTHLSFINAINAISTVEINDINALRALCLISRAMLIMADHAVSATQINNCTSNASLAANTSQDLDTGKRHLNQDLNWHLLNVGDRAEYYASHLFSEQWQGLEQSALAAILGEASTNSRFRWQNTAVESIAIARKQSNLPMMIMNVAGTGAGKTRMNAKAAAAANRRNKLRFTTALGLRTLTLQTGKAYQKELGLNQKELSCIIGSRMTKQLFDLSNIDENPGEEQFTEFSMGDYKLPEWTKSYLELKKHSQTAIIGAPVLVSTIDYLAAAGDPHKQGCHVDALLRLGNSDLILDEVDDYSPKSFVAICRIVEMAAMLGSNVITSSATLPLPMAEQLGRAFLSGINMHKALYDHNEEKPFIGFIDNYLKPHLFTTDDAVDIKDKYASHIHEAIEKMEGSRTKFATIASTHVQSIEACCSEISAQIRMHHEDHKWTHQATSAKISFGLVRIGNIKNVYRAAKILANQLPNAFIATYHAQDLVLHRSLKEQMLDSLLNRKDGNSKIEESEYIKRLVETANTNDIPFIVIASPVEEVGRDHDFDWAIIEPSSARSIVQTAGRINRHRLKPISKPNITILERTFKCIEEGQCEHKAHYRNPGFESDSTLFDHHSMHSLLEATDLTNVTAKLRFGNSRLSQLEDLSIEETLKSPLEALTLAKKGKQTRWCTEAFYNNFPLRENNKRDHWLVRKDGFYQYKTTPRKEFMPERFDGAVIRKARVNNSWLNWPLSELFDYCEQNNLDCDEAMSFSLPNNKGEYRIIYDESFGIIKA
ncbi:MAG: CRISPR-associated endonuclease Cas3'' [Pseudomonadales bacterium]|nr:CRISPR-associated endonuclease Cas3'' [Pseudomonadales bacterium]